MTRGGEPDYARLLAFRVALRRFSRWTEGQARAVGVTPAQHQLMLCVRGSENPRGPTVSDVADCLLLRHHSVVELIDRAVAAGLVVRKQDDLDARSMRIRLTPKGARRLRRLSDAHQDEVRRLAELLRPVLDRPADL